MDSLTLPPSSMIAPRSSTSLGCASSGAPRALILAADRLVGHGAARMLEGAVAGIEILDSMEAALSGPAVALVIVHADLPGLSAARVAKLVQRRQATALLGAAGAGPTGGLAALRAAGARGVLTGAETPAMCAGMIQLLLAGGSCWPADMALGRAATAQPHRPPGGEVHLTARQCEIAEGLVRGESNKVIAHTLGITEGTAKIHLTALFRALGVRSRTAAVVRLIPLLRPTARDEETPNPSSRQDD